MLETSVYKVLGMENGKKNPVVESVISNVAIGANDPTSGDQKYTILNWDEYRFHLLNMQNEMVFQQHLILIQSVQQLKGIPGAQISVDQERAARQLIRR